MTRTIDRDQLCDDVEHGDLIPLSWDDTYMLMRTLQHLIGDLLPSDDNPAAFSQDLNWLSHHAHQLARLAEHLYAVAPRNDEEALAERERVLRPRPRPSVEDTAPTAAPREPEPDLVYAFWALSQAMRAEGKHPEVIAKDAVAHLEKTRAAAT